MPKRKLVLIRNAAKPDTAELLFYGPIGAWWGEEDAITAKAFAKQIRQLGSCREMRLCVDSEGGDVFQAADIYATLMEADIEHLIIDVRGICASAATLVAMAGDKICAASNATWMVHAIQGGVWGDITDLEDYLKVMRDLDETTKRIYAARTGCPRAKLDQLMSRDSYLTVNEAVELGFVDEIYEVENKRTAAATNRVTLPPPTARLDCDLDDAKRSIARLASFAGGNSNGGTPVAETTPAVPPAPVNTAPAAPPAAPPTTPPVAPTNATPPAPPVTPAVAPTTPAPAASAGSGDPRTAPQPFDSNTAAEVISLCNLAGCPDKAAGYVKSQTPLDVVRGQLLQHVCANRQLTAPPAGGSPDPAGANTPEAKFGKEFDDAKKQYLTMGISREQYIASRMKDADQETE